MSALRAVFIAAVREAWVNRRSFWVQVTAMVVNDLTWVVFWFLFFRRVGSVRGWDVEGLLTLLAIVATVIGFGIGLLANARRIGSTISSGQLDAVLALPVDPLGYLLVRRVDPALLGDLAFGPLLFLFATDPTPVRAATFVFGVLIGSVVFVSFLVFLGSLTFFVGGKGEQADLGFQALILVAQYPVDLFAGFVKLLLFVAIPAAFVSGLPARLVTSFDVRTAALLVVVAVGLAALARSTFVLGLRRYRSGSAWVRA
jgi:ABC-2 type transport system permease protein